MSDLSDLINRYNQNTAPADEGEGGSGLRSVIGGSSGMPRAPGSSGGMPRAPLATPSSGMPRAPSPASPGGMPRAGGESEDRTVGERVGSAFGGAVRGLASALEPFQLPQDLLYGLLAGAKDQNMSPVDYWRQVEWRKYAPLGEAPQRVSSGDEILGLYGVENEAARKWGGLAMDFVADPLLVGGWMWGVGKAVKAVGAVDTGNDLIRVGRNIDDALGLIPTTRGGVTRGIPTVVPQAVRNNVSDTFSRVVSGIMDRPLPTVAGSQSRRFLSDAFRRRGQALQSQGAAAFRTAGRSAEEGAEVGRRMFVAEGASQQLASNTREYVMERLTDFNKLLGNESGTWWKNLFEAVGLRSNVARSATGLSRGTQDAVLSSVFDISDNHGAILFAQRNLDEIDNPAARNLAAEFEILGDVATPGRVQEATQDIDTLAQRIRRVAEQNGDNADMAERALREGAKIVSESDALIGYQLSMMGPVRNQFLQTVSSAGYAAEDVWNNVLTRGLRGDNISDITELRVRRANLSPAAQEALSGMERTQAELGRRLSETRTVSISELFGENYNTLGDVLNSNEFFQTLDLTTFIKGLGEGHLRRSFGAFMDQRTFDEWFESIKDGRLLANNVIDETGAVAELAERGFTRESELLQQYIEGVTRPADMTARRGPRGVTLRTRNLTQHLIQNGVDRAQAQRAVDQLVGSINGSPAYERFVEKVRGAMSEYMEIPGWGGRGTGAATFLQRRENLSQETLEVLGEIANPIISLEESSRFAQRVLPTQNYLRELYTLAENRGLISDSRLPGMTELTLPNDPQLGPFAGRYTHPFIQKELNRALMQPAFRTNENLEKVSQFIRGSLLSGPNILSVNMGGGVYTSSLLGVNPLTMIREMIETTSDIVRFNTGKTNEIPQLRRLQEFFPVQMARMSDASLVERGVRSLRRQAAGLNAAGVRNTLDSLGDVLRTFVDNPAELLVGGSGGSAARKAVRGFGEVLGLRGFSTSESVMKLSAFKAALRQGFNEAEAAEIARLSTFDYGELPDILRGLRDTGILMFPGFSTFILGRTVSGALRRPGVTAATQRLPEMMMDAQLDEAEQDALYAGMPQWLREEIGVPIRSREVAGNRVVSTVPWNQFMPQNVLFANPMKLAQPFTDSAASLGIYSPFFEVLNAFVTGSGEAPFSRRYGMQVFEPGSNLNEQVGQAFGFLYQNLAPSLQRKLVGYQPGEGFQGVIPSIMDSFVELPEPFADMGYTRNEIIQERVQRDLIDNLISLTFRSVQPIAIEGPLQNVQRVYNSSLYEFQEKLGTIQNRMARARLRGDDAEVQRLSDEAIKLRDEFMEEWGPVQRALQNYRQQQTQESR